MSSARAPHPRIVRLALLAGLVAGGCAARGATPPPDGDLLMRTYTVQTGKSDLALKTLSDVVRGGPTGARVEQLPDGRLLLIAPEGVHEGVPVLLDGLGDPPPIRSAELDYWIVLGEPASAASFLNLSPEIAPALQDIVASQGPMKFTLLETSRLSSMLDEAASAQGSRAQVRQVVSIVAGELVADVNIDVRLERGDDVQHRSLQSRVTFEPGRSLLLGQSGFVADPKATSSGPQSTVFYIVRGEVSRGR